MREAFALWTDSHDTDSFVIFVSCFWLLFFFNVNEIIVDIISVKYLIALCLFIFSTDFVAFLLGEAYGMRVYSWVAVSASFSGSCLLIWVGVTPGLSLIFQVDGELKKVAGGQKKSGAAAELVAGG